FSSCRSMCRRWSLAPARSRRAREGPARTLTCWFSVRCASRPCRCALGRAPPRCVKRSSEEGDHIAADGNRFGHYITTVLSRFANPARFMRVSVRVLPWCGRLSLVVLVVGLYLSLEAAPPDYQQGDAVRI